MADLDLLLLHGYFWVGDAIRFFVVDCVRCCLHESQRYFLSRCTVVNAPPSVVVALRNALPPPGRDNQFCVSIPRYLPTNIDAAA